jgi:hypothetical protein
LRGAGGRVTNILFTLVYSSFGAGRTLAAIAGSILMLDSELDESGSLIYWATTTRMMKMGEMGRKGGGLYGKFLQLHLHYICIRRKPHGLIARAWRKSLPGPAHGPEPTAQQLRPLLGSSPVLVNLFPIMLDIIWTFF